MDALTPFPDRASALSDRVQRLEAVVEASVLVNSTLDLKELAEHVVRIAARLIGAERGSLFLLDDGGRALTALVAEGMDARDAPLRVAVGEGIVGTVAASGEALILNDAYGDRRFSPEVDRVTGFRTRSLLTVPVRDRDGVLVAVLQLLNRTSGDFTTADVDFLAELGVPFAIALTTARLHAEIVQRERLREELRLAGEIQRALQPPDGAAIAGLALHRLVRPSFEVGGDYHDLIPDADGGRWWLVVADVSGKGVAAGLIASNIQAYLWSRRSDRRTLERVMAEGNDLLYRLAAGRKYATVAIAEWRVAERELHWVSAGHPPALLRRGGQVEALEATGVPLGLLPDQRFGCRRLRLDPGDTLLMYTDGVVEAGLFERGDDFGDERLQACLEGTGSEAEVVDRVERALADHLDGADAGDDVTVLCARVTG